MRRLLAPRALAAVAVPLLLAGSATSLRPESVSTHRAETAAALPERADVLGRLTRAARSAAPAPTTTTTTAPAPRKVRPAAGGMTGWFGERRGSRAHPGIDLDGDTGDPIVAAMAGTVVIAGPAPAGYGGYGLMVQIDHGFGLQTLYAHLSSVAVPVGVPVAAGQLVGAMGSTGSSTGSHLHFEVLTLAGRVDPAAWLNEP